MDRISQLKAFLEGSPGDGFLQHALALEYVKTGDDAAARAVFETLLSAQPDYVGSYYHLGKLLERIGDNAEAVRIYEKGMEVAKAAGDRHAYAELQAAHEDLTDA
ncbi:tetratricopeptide repeat protein [Chitinophaga lutea]